LWLSHIRTYGHILRFWDLWWTKITRKRSWCSRFKKAVREFLQIPHWSVIWLFSSHKKKIPWNWRSEWVYASGSRNFCENMVKANLQFPKYSCCHSLCVTVWKNEKFTLIKKNFRQINSLVISLVKPLLSRNFCQKCVRVNFRNFHTVCVSQCGNYRKLTYILSHFFLEINEFTSNRNH